MTDIDLLRRNVATAQENLDTAKTAFSAASKALQDALDAESGMIGHVVEYQELHGTRSRVQIKTLRLKVERVDDEYVWGRPVTAKMVFAIQRGLARARRDSLKDLGVIVVPEYWEKLGK